MQEDGRWITLKSGKKVFLREGQSLVDAIIRGNQQTFELFHGTSNDFEEFDDKYIGKNSRGGLSYGKGHYFMDEQSDIYGQKGYKIKVNLKKPFIVQHNMWSAELERMGYDWFDSSRLDPSDFLASKGYDGTIIKNGDRIAEAIIYTNKDKKIKITKKTNNF